MGFQGFSFHFKRTCSISTGDSIKLCQAKYKYWYFWFSNILTNFIHYFVYIQFFYTPGFQ